MVWAVILAGCVHFRTVSTEIAPTVTAPEKYPARVAVYFAPRLLNCEVIRKPDTRYGAEHEYHYRWGPAVAEALTRSVKTAYTDVTTVTVPPGPGQFDRVIAFDLPKVDLVVEFVPGYLSQEARARASINLTMEILDGKTMRSLKNLPVTARGSFDPGRQRLRGLCVRQVHPGHGKGHSATLGDSFQPGYHWRRRDEVAGWSEKHTAPNRASPGPAAKVDAAMACLHYINGGAF